MKHSQDIRSVQNLKTLRGERMGSMPKEGRSLFLDLYLQEKEKERLFHEIRILNKKILLNQKKLERTMEHIHFIRNQIDARENIAPPKAANSKNLNEAKNNRKRKIVRRDR